MTWTFVRIILKKMTCFFIAGMNVYGVCLTLLDFDKNSENWQIDLRYKLRSNREWQSNFYLFRKSWRQSWQKLKSFGKFDILFFFALCELIGKGKTILPCITYTTKKKVFDKIIEKSNCPLTGTDSFLSLCFCRSLMTNFRFKIS